MRRGIEIRRDQVVIPRAAGEDFIPPLEHGMDALAFVEQQMAHAAAYSTTWMKL
jgi:hypothetical protein